MSEMRTGHWCAEMSRAEGSCLRDQDGCWSAESGDDGEHEVFYIHFCPWCGDKLEAPKMGGLTRRNPETTE